jgi:hypothetical protein
MTEMTAEQRCAATTSYSAPHSLMNTGVQCKYAKGHEGDHAGYAGAFVGDIFWPRHGKTFGEISAEAEVLHAEHHPGTFVPSLDSCEEHTRAAYEARVRAMAP